jgi:quercetin dioxygenase-like cupin family protein
MRAMLSVAMRIDRWDARRDGLLTEVALRRKMEGYGYEVSTCSWPAGTILPAQTQERDRAQAIVSGVVKMTLDGESAILTGGDIVYVPRGVVRRVEVVGVSKAHCLDATWGR